jgi:bacillolysin
MKIITVAAIWGILQLQQLFIECVHGEQDTSQQQQQQHQHQHHHHRVLRRNKQGLPAIVVGRLGHVKRRMANNIDNHDNHDDDMNNDEVFRTSLQTEVLTILREKFGSLGHEDLRITGRIRKSRDGSFHVRLQELINGLPVEGTGLSVHFSTNGTIYAMNGEHMDGSQAALTATIHGDKACGLALLAANVSVADIVQQSPPELTNVMDFDGRVRLAWKCQVEYHATDFLGQRSFRRDIIYGDAQDGSLCAIHPKVYGFRSSRGRSSSSSTSESAATGADVQTFTCVPANTAAPDPFQKTCTLYSDSTNVIDTGHGPLDSAHNYALATFKYYMENHDLWSIDGQGMPLMSYVLNQAFNVDNAFWSSDSMTYGDGHQWFLPMSMDAGVVGHEFVRIVPTSYLRLLLIVYSAQQALTVPI